jgi:hypothetical protein
MQVVLDDEFPLGSERLRVVVGNIQLLGFVVKERLRERDRVRDQVGFDLERAMLTVWLHWSNLDLTPLAGVPSSLRSFLVTNSVKVTVSGRSSWVPHISVLSAGPFLVKGGWSAKFPELSTALEGVTEKVWP